jgi:hypothetical protein
VRGDSLRDRYAKGLALLGLGMLASAGAVVDYWPTVGRLPLVPPAEREILAQVQEPARDPLAIVIPAQAQATRLATVSRAHPIPVPVPAISVAQPPVLVGQPVALVAPVASAEPVYGPAEPLATLVSAEPPTQIGAASSLILPPLVTSRNAVDWPAEADHHDGFPIPGAVKTAGASILRTSARAGASVFDAFRSLGGTLLRALPN